MGKSFVLSDESINSYGFRVITSGINLDNFKKNPIMLWNHTRSWGDKNNILPIGRWDNIRVEDGKLIADANFDIEDKFAAEIARKVEKGIINMTSIGIVSNEESDSAEYILPGQSRKTVTKCTLREVSIVDIGSNANAVVLYNKEGIELSANGECSIALINSNNQNKNEMELKQIALKLGLSETATEAEVDAKLTELRNAGNAEKVSAKEKKLTDRIAVLEQEKQDATKRAIQNLVDQAVVDKKITADKKSHFVALGEKVGIESLTATLSCMNAGIKPTEIIGGAAGHKTDKKYSELSEKELIELRDNDRQTYEALYEKEFGFKPVID